jgi:hypothetical protein
LQSQIQTKNPEDAAGSASVLELIASLVEEWRLIVIVTGMGLIVSAVAYLTYVPLYYGNLVIEVGAKYGPEVPQALETPFLLARRIKLKFPPNSGEHIEAKIYENDFDLKKRMSLELKIGTLSAARTLGLEREIVEFVAKEHAQLAAAALAEQRLADQHFAEMLGRERVLLTRYMEMRDARLAGKSKLPSSEVEQVLWDEALDYLNDRIEFHRALLKKTSAAMERNKRFATQTIFTLAPDADAINVSEPLRHIFLVGAAGGLFIGCIAAAVVLALRKRRGAVNGLDVRM